MSDAAATPARHPATPPYADKRDRRLLYAVLAVIGVLAWLLCHPYQGLFHDANLYALQALARLDPEALSHDVFLSHGSQDRYTLFSPLYAGAITLLGLDHAAALLTALSQAGLCASAWWLARARLSCASASAGVVLLIALPGDYGPLHVFACIEPFLTPRMAAEALTLGALAASLHGKAPWVAGLLLLAALLHPVMALAGFAVLVVARLLRMARSGVPASALALAVAILAAGVSAALLVGGRFDAQWLAIVQARSPYLFLSAWNSEDWSRALTGLVPLAAGAQVFDATLKRAALSVLLATLAGWLATFVGADVLHAVFITQVQPWRIEWLASAAGALLLPALLTRLWQGERAQRAAALLIVAALIFRAQPYAVPIGVAAILLLTFNLKNPRHANLLLFGALGVCSLAVLWRVASDLEFTDLHYLNSALPLWLRRAMSVAKDGALLGALVAVALWVHSTSIRRLNLTLLLLLAGVVGVVSSAQITLGDWFAQSFPTTRVADFEAWRAQVPPQAQVLWNASPLPAWALLRRANYLSGLQTSGVVFSRAGALELKRRAESLSTVIAPANFLRWETIGPGLALDPTALVSVCRLGAFDYLIADANLPLVPMASLATGRGAKRELKLYRCADPR